LFVAGIAFFKPIHGGFKVGQRSFVVFQFHVVIALHVVAHGQAAYFRQIIGKGFGIVKERGHVRFTGAIFSFFMGDGSEPEGA